MKIVFFGTSEFAIPALRELIDAGQHEVLALVTRPDRKKGRSLKLSQPLTKVLALAKGIPVYQPEDVSGSEACGYLKRLEADLFVVISFGQILRKEILAIPRLYSINLHGSLLPKYRGAAPTNWTVINGDKTTGISIIKMNDRMDEGDVILKKEITIDPEDTNITLNEKLSELGAKALPQVIDLIETGNAKPLKQDNDEATYAPKLKKADGRIDWSRGASEIHNMVRGLLPWPGAYTGYYGKVLKILSTEVQEKITEMAGSRGEVLDIVRGKGIIVRTGSGDLIIKHLQLEGKSPMDPDAFVRGHKIPKGYILQ